MSDTNGSYKHDASDRKLDQAANTVKSDAKENSGPSHDPQEIARHDDAGKDRLFERREQHDDAEKQSERTRIAKDVAKHHHPDEVAESGS